MIYNLKHTSDVKEFRYKEVHVSRFFFFFFFFFLFLHENIVGTHYKYLLEAILHMSTCNIGSKKAPNL